MEVPSKHLLRAAAGLLIAVAAPAATPALATTAKHPRIKHCVPHRRTRPCAPPKHRARIVRPVRHAPAPPPAPPEKPPALLAPSAASGPALSDQAAAALVQTSAFEPRPDNAVPNATTPSEADLARFRAQDSLAYGAFVTGHYSGTTDEILQWAARKWGFDPQLLRAVAAIESSWHMATSGPYVGIFQISPRYHCCADLAAGSTAFSADYYGASIRSFLDGSETWLNSAPGNGAPYAAGDQWGSVGAWASGRWHDAGAEGYIAKVQSALAKQPWLDSDF